MQPQLMYFLSALGVGLLTILALRYYIKAMRARRILEMPTPRSSHTKPLPTGGGWVVIGIALVAWLVLVPALDGPGTALLAATLALALVSWLDDLVTLPASVRLAVQLAAASALLWQLPPETRVIWDELPIWLDRLITCVSWLWFINLYNFMDGIDGITASQTVALCIGFILLSQTVAIDGDIVLLSALVAGTSAGFLIRNWHPAKIILGDVGAIPLGFLLGWFFIQLASQGHLAAAFILPLYYLADATITLVKRILQRKKFWHPHREHFYQAPVVAGMPHSAVVLRIIPVSLILIGAAYLSITAPWTALALALLTVAGLLFHLNRLTRKLWTAAALAKKEDL